MSKKAVKISRSAPKAPKALVVFGLDETGKPHAARFPADQADLVTRAARSMALRLGVATTGEHFEVVNKLPVGRIHASGKGLIPTVHQDLYDKIITLVGGELGPIATVLPTSWDEIASGHLIIAQESVDDGWWEAVVTKREGDMLTLKWRDAPGLPEFVRPIKAVALLNSDTM